jgi:hypothetical protein
LKIKTTHILLSLLLCVAASTANAYNTYGARGCGKLVSLMDSRAESDKTMQTMTDIAVKAWIAGYITAYNSWLDLIDKRNDSDIMASTDLDGVYMSLMQYCRDNPLENAAGGMEKVIQQLESKSRPKSKKK